TSDTLDPYLDITLDIHAAHSVKQALTQFVEPEELRGENAYHCGVCLQKRPASKPLSVHTSSKVLILLLKRFSHLTGEKTAKRVQYSEWLDMQPYMSDQNRGPLWYSLYAVLVHAGSTSRSGHYLAYVKAGDGHWYQMNDDRVTACDRSAALSQEAYVLFYVQRSNLGTDRSSGSAAGEEESVAAEDKDLINKARALQTHCHRAYGKAEEQAQESTLEEWKSLQEQIQAKKPPLNLRKVEGNLPDNAVVIHPSKHRGALVKTHPGQDNFCPNTSARSVSPLERTGMNHAPCVGEGARAPKRKNKNKNKNNQQHRRPALVIW
ncbi:ubiquitin carboxyl-terminal hydrolase 17-like protein 13, partial [Octodon degus]|uniref:ubiquitinyl hydrolase 1 n=1 Tax=Octodon degus TaxID=10160 RepID=A0A6P3FMW0_OCTDE